MSLHDFALDAELKREVKEFMFSVLDQRAIQKVYAREDTSGTAEAHKTIEEAFNLLDEMVEKAPSPSVENEAR